MQEDNASDLITVIINGFLTAWNFTLFRSGDNEISVSQVVIAILIILIGVAVSKRLSKSVTKRFEKSGKFNQNTVYVLQRLITYVLIVIVTLVALPIAGIPITIFTVLGGAVAIGVGFGAQNLFNNLISGFIIMVERPIRIGDIVELNDAQGKIADIGNRCVRVRRGDGVDVLVPNSHFLEQPVVNWTLHDSDIRGKLSIGVAYGSPCREVERLMMKAAAEHPKLLKEKHPFVLFEDFGDSALVFNLFYWSMVAAPLDLRRVNSDLRFRIDELFAEAEIVIAFPQRDVHLDTLKPLEIKMVKGEST